MAYASRDSLILLYRNVSENTTWEEGGSSHAAPPRSERRPRVSAALYFDEDHHSGNTEPLVNQVVCGGTAERPQKVPSIPFYERPPPLAGGQSRMIGHHHDRR